MEADAVLVSVQRWSRLTNGLPVTRKKTMKKLIFLVVALSLATAACASPDSSADTTAATTTTIAAVTTTQATTTTTTLPPTTTTTLSPEEIAQAELEADTEVIKAMWREYSDSWFGGAMSGIESLSKFNHWMLECSLEDYEAAGWVDGDEVEIIVDAASIERADGWTTTNVSGETITPDGRIYIMTADIASRFAKFDDELTKSEIHAVVVGGAAWMIWGCGRQ